MNSAGLFKNRLTKTFQFLKDIWVYKTKAVESKTMAIGNSRSKNLFKKNYNIVVDETKALIVKVWKFDKGGLSMLKLSLKTQE